MPTKTCFLRKTSDDPISDTLEYMDILNSLRLEFKKHGMAIKELSVIEAMKIEVRSISEIIAIAEQEVRGKK